VPAEPEAVGLLALMLLHESRRTARSDAQGNLITLEQQDRACWDRKLITAGTRLLDDALALGRPGSYQIQAAISALHAQAPSYAATDWREITLLYGKLHALWPSPVVRLNAAVALSYAEGAEAAIPMLIELERQGALARYQPFHAAHADMLRRAGRKTAAAKAYRQAITLTRNAAERRFLEGRLGSVLD